MRVRIWELVRCDWNRDAFDFGLESSWLSGLPDTRQVQRGPLPHLLRIRFMPSYAPVEQERSGRIK